MEQSSKRDFSSTYIFSNQVALFPLCTFETSHIHVAERDEMCFRNGSKWSLSETSVLPSHHSSPNLFLSEDDCRNVLKHLRVAMSSQVSSIGSAEYAEV